MNLFIIVSLILFALILSNFKKSIVGTGPVEIKTYNISKFSSFNMTGNLKVTVNIGDEYLVQVKTHENIFDYFDILVKNNVLIYDLKSGINQQDVT